MPKPSYQQASPAASRSKGFLPFTQKRKQREEMRRQKEEQAAKEITNNRAENEQKIIDTLASINFVRSKIPAETLDYKSDPSQPWGDLEYACKGIQKMLRDSPDFAFNTVAIDEKILQLAKEFNSAVTIGNVRAAYAAKSALLTCISKIRNKIPNISSELVEGFIERSVTYINTWILLVDSSRVADELEKNITTEKQVYDKSMNEQQASCDELLETIQGNDEYLEAFYQISDLSAPEDPTQWSETMRKVRKMMVDMRFKKANLGLTVRLLDGKEYQLKKQEGKIETLSAKVAAATPIPEDPNADNKYNEEVNAIFDELASIDTEIDELLTTVEDIEGRLQSLDNAPGAIHMRNAIAQQAEDMIKNIQEKQDKEVSAQGVNRERLLKKLNIRSEEEQKALVEQAQQEQQRLMAELALENAQSVENVNYEEQTESNQLYVEE